MTTAIAIAAVLVVVFLVSLCVQKVRRVPVARRLIQHLLSRPRTAVFPWDDGGGEERPAEADADFDTSDDSPVLHVRRSRKVIVLDRAAYRPLPFCGRCGEPTAGRVVIAGNGGKLEDHFRFLATFGVRVLEIEVAVCDSCRDAERRLKRRTILSAAAVCLASLIVLGIYPDPSPITGAAAVLSVICTLGALIWYLRARRMPELIDFDRHTLTLRFRSKRFWQALDDLCREQADPSRASTDGGP